MATGRERERKLKGERSRRQKALPRIQRDTAAEVKKLLRRAGRDVCAALAGAPSEFDAFLLPRLQASIRQALERLGAGAGAVAGDGASRAWRAGIDLIDGPLDAALGLDAPAFRISAILPQVDARQLLAMRGFLTHKMSGVATALADRINTELGLTMIGTRNVGDTVRRVADILGKGGRSRALTVVRTELGRAYSIAAHERQAPGGQGPARPQEGVAALRQAAQPPGARRRRRPDQGHRRALRGRRRETHVPARPRRAMAFL